jgi:hypothetical protein
VQRAQDAPHAPELLRSIGDGEALAEPDLGRVLPEDLHSERMERADRRAAHALSDELLRPILHLERRFVGEGHAEDLPGEDAAIDQMRQSIRDHAGLAGSCPGEHQQRTIDVEDRLELLSIEPC